MDSERFVNLVTQGAGIDRASAERTVRATLETLAQRISPGEARDLASQLAPELAPWLNATQRSQRFDVDEFIGGRPGGCSRRRDRAKPRACRVRGARAGGRAARARRSRLRAAPGLQPAAAAGPARGGHASRRLRLAGGGARGARRGERASCVDAVLERWPSESPAGRSTTSSPLAPALHEPLTRGREHGGGLARTIALERSVALIAERGAFTRRGARARPHGLQHAT